MPEVAKRRVARRHGEITAGDELASPAAVRDAVTRAITGCGRRVMLIMTSQQRAKQPADEFLGAVREHFLEVVSRTVCFAVGAYHYHPHRAVVAMAPSAACSASSISIDKRIELLGAVQAYSVVTPLSSLRSTRGSLQCSHCVSIHRKVRPETKVGNDRNAPLP